ncbi:hypothetical protein BX666DRAFT_2001934 [Dichotomocladium elegans]|nr:hypothetical protein BX666DRAFT_2001934 [Dichotomocladium elegans]
MHSPIISLQTTDTNGATAHIQQKISATFDPVVSFLSSNYHTACIKSIHSRGVSLETLSTNLASSVGFTSSPTPVADENIISTISDIKLKGGSAESRRGHGTLLPTVNSLIAAPDGAADAASRATFWEIFLYSYRCQQQIPPLVKDDVFFAPAISDDDSVITTHSNSSIGDNSLAVGNSAPTPCLSPVTAPADFLCNHEPLFDGIDDLQQHQHQHQQQQQIPDDSTCARYLIGSMSSNNNENSKSLFDIYDYQSLHALSPQPTFASSDDEYLPDADDHGADMDGINSSASSVCSSPSSSCSELDAYQCSSIPSLKRKLSLISQNDNNSRPDPPYRRLKAKPAAKRRAKRHLGRRSRQKPVIAPYHEQNDGGSDLSIFERLTQAGIDWCRYCGTTEGVNWRPGPWGKRTLCNKHGCDYKGYGIASRLPRLDLSAFANERLEDRKRPVVQQTCIICQHTESTMDNKLISCEGGCSHSYHQLCRIPAIDPSANRDKEWCCNSLCRQNRKRSKVGPYDA